MSKPFYSDYVTHMLRYYARHDKKYSDNEISKLNWCACDSVLKTLPTKDRSILMDVYWEKDILADNIYQVSRQNGIPQNNIWTLVRSVEAKIAKVRGLI